MAKPAPRRAASRRAEGLRELSRSAGRMQGSGARSGDYEAVKFDLEDDAGVAQLADWLVAFSCDVLGRLERRYAPGWKLPALLAGHPVGSDARGDLAFDLGLLAELGVREAGGVPVEAGIREVLGKVDGEATHSFYSYRIAETLLRFGGFAPTNPLLADGDARAHANLAACCDSTALIERLGTTLPKNYVAVLARCELARERLGLAGETSHLPELIEGTRSLLAENPLGFIDDSNDGSGRFDIYLADVYLFTEPLAERLGALWRRGLERVCELVAVTCTADGSAIPWGRSIGALGVAMTVELAAVGLARGLFDATAASAWRGRLVRACRQLPEWFGDGLISAHQYRSTFAYRGPQRRLQMSLDVVGKLLQSAIALRCVSSEPLGHEGAEPERELDHLVRLSFAPSAHLWSFRDRQQRFVVPLVGGSGSDYLPAPRNPGMFEVPVDSALATGVPVALFGDERVVPAGPPEAIEKRRGRLRARWRRGTVLRRRLDHRSEARPMTREVSYAVRGSTLEVQERLGFDMLPDGIGLQIAERDVRPLHVEFDGEGIRSAYVDTRGLAEYRSFFGELWGVHQVDVPPAREVEFGYRITPKLRIATNAREHHYHRSLYDPIADWVHEVQFPWRRGSDLGDLDAFFRDIDLFHLHWPEHFLRGDREAARAVLAALERNRVRIVFTQHNLTPHRAEQRAGAHALYQMWAEAAHGVIHHSDWGRRQVHERYAFREGAIERVIPHGHFGNLIEASGPFDRSAVEAELGLTPCAIRLGVVGAPRAEKNVQRLLDAFAASRRRDIQLFVTCRAGESVPDDPRIVALDYEMVPRPVYDARLAVMDALVMPIEAGQLLTTGVVGDAIGAGLPAITSDWAYLTEMLGGAALRYDGTTEDLTRLIDRLTVDDLAAARTHMLALRERFAWPRIAQDHLAFLREVGTEKI